MSDYRLSILYRLQMLAYLDETPATANEKVKYLNVVECGRINFTWSFIGSTFFRANQISCNVYASPTMENWGLRL